MIAIMSRFGRDNASKRLEQLYRVLNSPLNIRTIKSSSVSSRDVLSIGDQSITINPAKHKELVPRLYVSELMPQSTLRHLKWIMQKDLLGQDMFLIGPSGPLKRHLAMMYCELTQKEVEYISLSRDTTEADLKQRREIINGTAHYVDQCAVKAATEGRVLIIEGIEKAERNVLPVLNNLLENREMALEDGRFLISPSRYDKLLKEHGQEVIDDWKLTRVSDQFRVIALGLPVPPYHGNPLDPPLRSRFQSRNIAHLPFHEQLEYLKVFAPGISDNLLSSILSVCSTMQTLSGTSHYGLMDFPMHQLKNIIKILNALPSNDVVKLLNTAFPAEMLNKQDMLVDATKRFDLPNKLDNSRGLSVHSVMDAMSQNTNLVSVTFGDKEKQYSITVPGQYKESVDTSSYEFVSTPQNEHLIAEMIQSHFVGDFCVVGEKGIGKSVLINEFARRLGYEIEPVMLYWDMTARDLCQQRVTLANGDTSWRLTPLIDAALKGRLAVLDGINKLDMGTLAVLQRLIHDREIVLFDGTKLLGRDQFNEAKRHAELSDEQMAQRSIFQIHDKFRIICTAEPQSNKNSGQHYTNHWSNPEFVSMFLFHHIKSLSLPEEQEVLVNKVSGLVPERIKPLLHFVHSLRQSPVPMVQSLASSLSTRQLLRIARRMVNDEKDNLYQPITRACLFRFLPQTVKGTLLQSLKEAGINPTRIVPLSEKRTTCEVNDNMLRIGNTTTQLMSRHNFEALVPDVLFYENEQHLRIMEDMLKDYMLGEHLLLVGNQGVGKNKIVDHFLRLMNLPREYLQLHRDTTVQTLTLQPSVQDGRIMYQDSPLVRAVKSGMVLVVDEADKAPTHVTCILKNLVESSEITLADGRRIISHHSAVNHNADSVIVRHPDFRMIVLANRPGFPFLGNDFFASIGDMFACHAVDNPDLESEMAMLKQYGPNVPEDTLKRLVAAFSELRHMSDDGTIAYPYSTREVVNIVKHLERFPNEGVASVVRNVFDFDLYHPELLEMVMKILHKHGIPVGASHNNVHLAQEQKLSPLKLSAEWSIGPHVPDYIRATKSPMKTKGPHKMKSTICPLDRVENRGSHFSECKSHWNLPMHEACNVESIGSGPGGHIHVSIHDPAVIYSMTTTSDSIQCVDISNLFPYPTSVFSPTLNLVGLNHELEGQLLLHDANSNALFLLDPHKASITEIITKSFFRSLAGKLTRKNTKERSSRPFCMCTELAGDNLVVLFQEGSSELLCVDVSNQVVHKMDISFPVKSLSALSNNQWIVSCQESDSPNSYLLYKSSIDLPVPDSMVPIEGFAPLRISATSADGLKFNDLGDALQQVVDENTPMSYSRMFTTPSHLAAVAVGLPFQPNSSVKFYSVDSHPNYMDISKAKPIILPNEAQVVYPALAPSTTQKQVGVTVVDLARHSLKEIKIKDINDQYTGPYYKKNFVLHAAKLGDDSVVVVDGHGVVQVLETGHFALHESLKQWKRMVGDDSSKALQMTYQRDSLKDVSQPKHGKVDPSNEPHVGGNTWAGGTGGRDTAGLGGKGGPYRLDAGHDVHQLSDAEKEAVPDEVKKAAREMNRKAFKAKLKEIQMSEYDGKLYQQFMSKVRKQINAIQLILNNVQSKGLERQWIKHQTSGDLDDSKLIEGLTGEKAIFKRRGEKHPEFGSPQLLPKCFRLVVDVSGSMYRFNGLDGRLERTLEATLMILEGFNNHHSKFKLDIVGHSGDTEDIQFVASSAPPANDRERLDVLKTMHAHSQYCWPGDNTLAATKAAIKEVTKEPADDYFVVVLSDANFSRYGINPDDFAKLLNSDPRVNTFAIFIGSLGDQAEQLKQCLPTGRAFICMNAADLPQILQQILTSSLL